MEQRCHFCVHIFKMPRTAQFFPHNFYATVDPDVCTGCGKCVNICLMGANKIDKKKNVFEVNLYKCIGCGNCIPVCPQNARKLIKKKKEIVPPKTDEEMFDIIMDGRKGRLGSFLRVLKIFLKNPVK